LPYCADYPAKIEFISAFVCRLHLHVRLEFLPLGPWKRHEI
jgi:hypothetical protein